MGAVCPEINGTRSRTLLLFYLQTAYFQVTYENAIYKTVITVVLKSTIEVRLGLHEKGDILKTS